MPSATSDQLQVRLEVWRVPHRDIPAAAVAGRTALRRLRADRAVSFAKLLGTASAAFTPRAATPTRWALLSCREGSPDRSVTSWWDRHAEESAALVLRPLWSRGTWDGVAPFGPADPAAGPPQSWQGLVVALTRSTLRLRRTRRFYRAVPPIAAELAGTQGCRVAFGIGEAPVLRQGTVSVWESAAAMHEFARRAPAHARAVAATPSQGWYAEELFARFALTGASGSIDGTSLG